MARTEFPFGPCGPQTSPVETPRPASEEVTADEPPEVCPTCGAHRPVIYERALNSSMVRALYEIALHFHRNPGSTSIHAISYLMGRNLDPMVKAGLTGGVHAKLVYWGLLEEAPEHGRGYYRMTARGWGFLRDQIMVSKSVRVCGGRVVGQSEALVTVRQASKEKFALDALMETRR